MSKSKSKAKTNGMKATVMGAMGTVGDKAQTVIADVKHAASNAADAVVKQAKVVSKKAMAAATTVGKAVDDNVVKPISRTVADARKRISTAKKPAKKKPAAKKAAAKKPLAKKVAAKKTAAKKAVKKAVKKVAKKVASAAGKVKRKATKVAKKK
jgi:DNA-binding protein HU-beta